MSFDILVAATGSPAPGIVETPGQSLSERQNEINELADVLVSGKHVVIAGGGAIGVELAGDALEAMKGPTKGAITIVSSSKRLLPDQEPYYSEKTKQTLEELGATIILGDRVTSHTDPVVSKDGMTVQLQSGKSLDCYAYVPAYARGASTAWLTTPYGNKGGLPASLLNDKRRVEVNEYLQSTAYDKLYALMDANSRTEPALVMNVEPQAMTAAANILSPGSKPVPKGVDHAVYQVVGHETLAFIMPENLPMPSFLATTCCYVCGFPLNLLCPCWLCGVVCGPIHPMTCGYCCGRPESKGLTTTIANVKKMGVSAKNTGYVDVGEVPTGTDMDRA